MSQTVAMSPRVEKFSTDILRCIVVFPCTYLMLLKVCCFVCSGSRISHLGEVNAKTQFNKRVGNITVLLFLCFENKLFDSCVPSLAVAKRWSVLHCYYSLRYGTCSGFQRTDSPIVFCTDFR